MRILVGAVLTAAAVIMMPSGAGAETSDAQRLCLANGTSVDQKLVACSSIIMNAPPGEPKALASVYISRGNAYLGKNDYGLALRDFDEATRIDPNNRSSYNGRGLVFLHQKQFDQAIAEFDQAIKLNPGDPIPWTNRGNAYREKGRFDRALQDYDTAITINPKWINAYFGRALTFQEKARYDFDAFLNEGSLEDRAIAEYTKVLQIAPNNAASYSNRGQLYLRERKYNLAIADFTQAVQLDPSNPLFIKNRAYTYRTIRQFDLAVADYRKALTLKVDVAMRKEIERALNELGTAA